MVKFFQDGWDLFIDWLDIYVTYRLHPSRKLITVFGVFTPVITIVIGYFINEMLKEFIPIFKTSYLVALKTLVTLDFIERHKYLYIYVGIALLFWICKNWIVSKYERESILHYGLYWFYTMMGYAHNQAADIRCTIWIPANKKRTVID